MRVKLTLLLFPLLAVVGATVSAQHVPPPLAPLPKVSNESKPTQAPPEVIASAVAAVASLGNEVVLGHYQVAVERMNPLWKERTAHRMGGIEALETQLADVSRQMVQQGISMISFKPQGQPRSYEVGPSSKMETVNGEAVETLVFRKWLILIPTVTKFRIIRPGSVKPLVIESTSFQVAISDKDANNWTFIDGSGMSSSDLRGLFVTLPNDLQLPPVEKRESR